MPKKNRSLSLRLTFQFFKFFGSFQSFCIIWLVGVRLKKSWNLFVCLNENWYWNTNINEMIQKPGCLYFFSIRASVNLYILGSANRCRANNYVWRSPLLKWLSSGMLEWVFGVEISGFMLCMQTFYADIKKPSRIQMCTPLWWRICKCIDFYL